MKVCGFTFIKNAITFDYPIVEAINSILPICDAFVIAIGNSSDNTKELIQSINSNKIILLDTIWDDTLKEGGKVLAEETNKAFQAIDNSFDWAFYIQGDEVIHEQYLDKIKSTMEIHLSNPKVDGLLFNYLHFYGSYDYVGASTNWYTHEIRIIRNNKKIYSFQDAQGFRKNDNEKLNVKAVDAYVYHYGWIREPEAMQKKLETFHRLWHDESWIEKNLQSVTSFDYAANMKELGRFTGTHPSVMMERIQRKNWKFETDISMKKRSLKDRFKTIMLKYFGWNLNYTNYKLLK